MSYNKRVYSCVPESPCKKSVHIAEDLWPSYEIYYNSEAFRP